MTAKWKKRVAAGVGCLAAAVLLTNLLCRVVFLNPVRRQEEILQTLSLNIQTLCPQVTYLCIQPAQADGWFNFSRYTQYLFVTESYHTNEI